MKQLDINVFAVIFTILNSLNWITPLNGQVTLSLTEAPKNTDETRCYHINLKNNSSKELYLAGQNYRLYYDATKALLIENSIFSHLPSAYTKLDLVQHIFDVDASGYGVLTYDGHLGFINLATDYNHTSQKPLIINSGTLLSVASMCFEVADGKTPEFTWAQDHLTHTYATAFVEIATLEGDQLKKANITDYKIIQNSATSTHEAILVSSKIFPNPFSNSLEITFNKQLLQNAILSMYDIFGREVLTQKLFKGMQEIKLESLGMPNGTYLIEIELNDGSKSILKAVKTDN